MTLADLVAKSYLKASGKRSTLTNADDKWLKLRDIANSYIEIWQETLDVDWKSLYNPKYTPGVVTATDTFTLDGTVRKVSDERDDPVQVISADGSSIYNYAVVPADTLKRYDANAMVCAQIGSTLVFRSPFSATSPLIGCTIYVPIYKFASTLTTDTDVVPVDIPQWLVLMTAAEYIRNDVTKQAFYPNLVQEANAIMQRMMENNDAQVNDVFVPPMRLSRTW